MLHLSALFNYFVLHLVQINVHIKMITTSISDFRKDIKKYLDKVSLNFETLIINRGKDKGIVIMTLEEYNSLNAYSHELSSLRNKERLDKAIEKLSNGNTFSKDLIEE